MSLLDRRDFLAAAGVTGLALSTDAAIAAARPLPGLIVADRRIAASRAFAARSGGRRVAWIAGDITDLWYGELDLLWRREKGVVSGLTEYPAFFCLERLGMDRGMRAAFREDYRAANGSSLLVGWVLAPGRPMGGIA